jgi:PAS domain S-box-containing protein
MDPSVETDPGTGGLRVFQSGQRVGGELSRRWLQALYETPLLFSGILDDAGRVLDANQLAVEGCGMRRAEVLGRPFWECGWWSPDPALAAQIRQWCEQCLATGTALRARSHYYTGDGARRTVDLALSPVVDKGAGVPYLVATGLDITAAEATIRERQGRLAAEAETLRSAEVATARHLAQVEQEQERAVLRLGQLVDATVAFAAAGSIDDLVNDVIERGVAVLGADAGMVAVRAEDWLTVTVSASLGHLPDWSQPLDSGLPMAHVARTGRRLLLPGRSALAAFSVETGRRYGATGRDAWAFFPLRPGGRLLGSLAVGWRNERELSEDEVGLLEAFSAQCGQALQRIQHQQAERSTARRVARLAEALQLSLLTRPPAPDGLDIAVRYLPAAELAKVGGDFYDAFVDAAGATVIAVGDIAGHDTAAAAAMAQIRNLLRGLAYDTSDGPAVVLARLDQALAGLDVRVLATALIARIGAPDQQGRRRLVWSNAGHPPPLVREPDGDVRVLVAEPGLMLGVVPDTPRAEHTLLVEDGSLLVLHTDGLIERRDQDIDDSIGELATSLRRTAGLSADQTCDTLLANRATVGDDDIALLAVGVAAGGPAARGKRDKRGVRSGR